MVGSYPGKHTLAQYLRICVPGRAAAHSKASTIPGIPEGSSQAPRQRSVSKASRNPQFMNIIHRNSLCGPAAAFLLVVAALAPIWVVILIAVAVGAWMVKGTWDNRQL